MKSVIRITFVALAVSMLAIGSAQAKTTKTFTFTNKSGVDANDLHVETKQAAEPKKDPTTNKYGEFKDVKAESGNKKSFSNGTVKKDASMDIEFDSTSNEITIISWYWTKDGRRVGNINQGNPAKTTR